MTPIVLRGGDRGGAGGGPDRGQARGARSWRPSRGWPPEQVAGLVVAYEPSGPSAPGQAATAVDAEDACVFIRALVAKAGW